MVKKVDMPDELLDEMQFGKNLKGMSDREVIEFCTNEVYKVNSLLHKIENTVYGTNTVNGLKQHIDSAEKKQKDNRKLIIAMWSFNGLILMSLIGLFITRLGGG